MHPLINRSIECFLRDTYGQECWQRVAATVGLDPEGYEAMLTYDDQVTKRLVEVAARARGKTPEALLEDVGTYLVSHPNCEGVRRLLRFSGETFPEFLHSIDELPDRIRLAVEDLHIPALELDEDGDGRFTLHVAGPEPGFAAVLTGLLRTLADDYGALVLLDNDVSGSLEDGRTISPPAAGESAAQDAARTARGSTISIALLDREFAVGRSFSLTPPEPV